jgi:hypothetical protein
MNLTMSLNFKGKSASQFQNLFSNSLGVFNSSLFLANEDGVYVLDSESEDEKVDAFFELPYSTLGYNGQKSPRSLLVAGKIDGKLAFELTDERDNAVEYESVDVKSYSGLKQALNTNQRSRYFRLRVKNIDGSFFSIGEMDVVFIPGPEART